MRMRWVSGALAALGVLAAGGAGAAQKTASFVRTAPAYSFSSAYDQYQLLYCDVADAQPGTGPATGEVCATGDWSTFVDARGWSNATVTVNEIGTGSISVQVWACSADPRTGAAPGATDPAAAPSSASPTPICVMQGAAVTGVDGGGGGSQVILQDWAFPWIGVRVDTCTGNCDGPINLYLSR